jgi:hypothetical protein
VTSFSHDDQLELMVCALSLSAILVYSSSSVWPVKSFGALYTMSLLSAGATASSISMSAFNRQA